MGSPIAIRIILPPVVRLLTGDRNTWESEAKVPPFWMASDIRMIAEEAGCFALANEASISKKHLLGALRRDLTFDYTGDEDRYSGFRGRGA